ncbi:MAG: peptidylprolyl isomerase, partial [Oscillospiraceae bacterium]|nr:peptidylprolyl isomerase [Oscillospiraceae bacterium]
MKKVFAVVAAAVMCLTMAACSAKTVNLSKVQSDEVQFAAPTSGDTVATIKTDKGDIKIKLYPEYAPLA